MKKSLIVLTVLLSAIMFTTTAGQTEYQFSENEIKNITNAVKSDNPGLKKSGIYFVYKYNIGEAVEVLKEEFKRSDDTALKVFIARTIHKVGNDEDMSFLKYAAFQENNEYVKQMCVNLYSHHLDSTKQLIAGR